MSNIDWLPILNLHERVPDHGRYSEDRRPCDKWCDHEAAGSGYVCAECRNYAGDHVEWPCRTVRALAAAGPEGSPLAFLRENLSA